VVGSQTASLTPDPSFAHNLSCRCPNDQCKAIFDIYASRPFQRHQEHPNTRCFGPCYRTLNIRESRRTPSPQLWECWASPPHLAKMGLQHQLWECWVSPPHLAKVGLRHYGTPKNSELNCRGQISLHLSVRNVIGKVLKFRCPKWLCMSHLDICSRSYGQKKGRESNWQFDSRPLKVGNRPLPNVR
jgi:hypothetical protein